MYQESVFQYHPLLPHQGVHHRWHGAGHLHLNALQGLCCRKFLQHQGLTCGSQQIYGHRIQNLLSYHYPLMFIRYTAVIAITPTVIVDVLGCSSKKYQLRITALDGTIKTNELALNELRRLEARSEEHTSELQSQF